MSKVFDLRLLLRNPLVYTAFQRVIGANRDRRKVLQKLIPHSSDLRVLEIGCGPGINVENLPEGIQYVGCDLSKDYIVRAKKDYGTKGTFIHAPVGTLREHVSGVFDYVLSIGVLHHLNDDEVTTLCDEARTVLAENGTFLALEPCFAPEQCKLERYIIAKDRGRFIRTVDQYVHLLAAKFAHVEHARFRGGNLTPNSGCVLQARI